ncbi:hypothetical protein DEM25_005640 [Oceaniradius stylonematis]|jgi:LPS-assembly lipoprotein|uniref:LPS-assembly lipoprotein n=2 Tax=Pseudomonadota TaxID=1224 RepID=A0A3A8AD87_9HYPH|nr:hypothetical protein DEM25_005640 [Oceaniradius stylonematis]RNC96653.1 MAG: hypothetical protein ED558_01910 [Oricola sp.]
MMKIAPDQRRRWSVTRRTAMLGALAMLGGCTVQPLYHAGSTDFIVSTAPLSRVSVDGVDDRISQQVRNELVFLLYNGGSVDPSADHRASLAVSSSTVDIFRVSAPDGSTNITARRVTLTGTLTLTRIEDGVTIASETRSATASFDNTRQEFANLRALRDAENRAAAELAERFRIVVATALAAR